MGFATWLTQRATCRRRNNRRILRHPFMLVAHCIFLIAPYALHLLPTAVNPLVAVRRSDGDHQQKFEDPESNIE